MRLALALLPLLAGCLFDRGGLAVATRDVATETVAVSLDHGLVEGRAPAPDSRADAHLDLGLDGAVVDASVVDTSQPDQTVAPKPIPAGGLGAAWGKARVPCVDKNGKPSGKKIPIVDAAKATFHAASAYKLPKDTKAWVAGKPAVSILWDPNACGGEEKPGDSNWDSAGLLVRGATLDGQKRLVLAPGATAADINLVNINPNGTWQYEFAKPDDSELATTHKQLVNPVAEAKAIVITLGTP